MGCAWQLQNPDAKLGMYFTAAPSGALASLLLFIVCWMFTLIALLGRVLPVGHAEGQAVYEILCHVG